MQWAVPRCRVELQTTTPDRLSKIAVVGFEVWWSLGDCGPTRLWDMFVRTGKWRDKYGPPWLVACGWLPGGCINHQSHELPVAATLPRWANAHAAIAPIVGITQGFVYRATRCIGQRGVDQR